MEQSLLIAKEQQRQLKRMLSLAVDTVGQLKVGVVTVHSLCIACFTTHNRKNGFEVQRPQNLKGVLPMLSL